MATSFSRYTYAIRIEGLGDQSTAYTDRRWRWCWGVSLLDNAGSLGYVDDLYRDGLLRWPREVEFSFDPRRGESSFGSLTFELRRTAQTLATFYGGSPSIAARLSSSLTASSTTVVLDTSGLTGTVYLEREAIYLGTESGAGPYTYSGCTRGVLGTQAVAHGATDEDDREVFASMHPATLSGRLVQLIRTPLASTTETDEEVVTQGVLRRIYSRGGGVITLEVDHAVALIKSTRIYRDPWRLPAAYLGERPEYDERLPDGYYAGGSGFREFLVVDERDGIGRFITADTTTVAGETVLGAIGSIDNPFMNVPLGDLLETWEFPALREFFTTHPSAPSNAASASTNTLPLRQNPGELILQLLLSTDNGGSPGANDPTYDTGVGVIAGAVPAALVDVDQIEAWGRRQPDMDSFHLGADGPEPVSLYDAITERILKPLGSAFIQRSGGKIGIASISDAQVYGVTNAIAQSQILSVDDLEMDRRIEDAVDQVALTYNARPGVEPDALNATDVIKYKRQPRGEHDRLEIDAGAWTDRPTATVIAQDFVARYHDPISEWSLSCLRTADFWPGDVVQVTHDKILSSGAQGVTAALCLVVARREVLDDTGWQIGLRVWHVGEIYDSVRFIAPSAKVASVAAGGAGEFTLTVAANQYTSTDGPALTADASGFAVNDKAQLVTKYGVIRDADVTVSAVSGNDITITGCGVTPVATDVLRVAEYGTATTSQRAAWAFISDADNLLGGTDPANEYVTA